MPDRKQILAMFQPLLEPIVEGVVITDRHGLVLANNSAVRRLFAMPEGCEPVKLTDLGGHNIRSILIQAGLDVDDEERHHCEMTLNFDKDFEIGGETRWLRINSNLVDLPCTDGRLRLIVFRDVTAEKRLLATMASKEACGVATADPDMLNLIQRLSMVAGTDASVLLQGESGTGKTELARLVHKRGQRAAQPFIEVNCGAIPASLIESELFGHVKGAFTGAVRDRAGRFKAADGGTLFLDEISELPRDLQAKLLRVLQDGEYEPVGADVTQKVDVRVVTASNQELREMVDQGLFRADLYYRIAVVPLKVPPLRERPGDIRLLVDTLLTRLSVRGYDADVRITPDAMRAIMNYPWPGNVRELANAMEHGVICAENGVVTRDSLPQALHEYCSARMSPSQNGDDARVSDRQTLEKALGQARGNKTLAAQILGIDRSTLWRRMRRLEMD